MFYVGEVFVRIQGEQHYLWHAVDQNGELVDVFFQNKRDVKRLNISSSDY